MQRIENQLSVKTILDERIRYFLELKSYLTSIKQKKVSSSQEINEFFRDVIGIKIPSNREKVDIFYAKTVPEILEEIEWQIQHHLQLRKCFEIKDENILITLLYIYLEHYTIAAAIFRKDLDKINDPVNKASAVFYNPVYLKMILKTFTDQLPVKISELNQVINIKPAGIHVRWEAANLRLVKLANAGYERATGQQIKNTLQKLDHIRRFKVTFSSDAPLEEQKAIQTIFNMANQIYDRIGSLIEETTLYMSVFKEMQKNNIFSFIKRQVELFFEYKTLEEKLIELNQRIDKSTRSNELSPMYLSCRDRILQIKSEQLKIFNALNKKIEGLTEEQDELLVQIKSDASNLNDSIMIFDTEWPPKLPDTLSYQNILENYANNKKQHQEIISQTKALEKLVNEYLIIKQTKERNERYNLLLEETKKHNAEVKKKIALYLAEQKNKIKSYKDEVSLLKEEKNAEKMPYSINTASQIEIPTPPIINSVTKSYLEKLDIKDLYLIREIEELKHGIKYRAIKNLITTLGGSICEIGNGSSHKRIYLNNLYSEFYTHAHDIEEKTSVVEPQKITGGMFKPHGTSHNSGELSLFNIKLIRSVFQRANLTSEKISEAIASNHSKITSTSSTGISV